MIASLLMYLKVILVGGAICALAELIVIRTKITPARILVVFLMVGAILGGFGLYNYVVEWAGAGATVPILGFGNTLANGAIVAVKTDGFFGALSGGLIAASSGVAVSIGLSYLVSFFVSSKTKKD